MIKEFIVSPNPTPLRTNKWLIRDDGRLPGAIHMAIDGKALFSTDLIQPQLRFFQWFGTTVTYGYLLEEEKVLDWARAQGQSLDAPVVQRPTGGGAVIHGIEDLSISLLWPRGLNIFPEKARDCYEVIHKVLLSAVKETQEMQMLDLFVKPTETCQQDGIPKQHFSACFQEPVCNDVMLGGQKIIGGALRVTRNAILYQGTIQAKNLKDFVRFKRAIAAGFNAL